MAKGVQRKEPATKSEGATGLLRAPGTRLVLASLAVAGAYFAGGKTGLLLAGSNPSVSAVWPPTGIAIAALLLGGSELWPAVFAGAFLVNLTTTWDLTSTIGIASGNTLEALLGSYFASRFASGRHLLERPRSVLTFALLSGLLATAVAATIGSASLTLAHLSPPKEFLSIWVPWWLGDAVGAMEIAPLILALALRASHERPVLPSPGWGEAALLGVVIVGIAALAFAHSPLSFLGGAPLAFLVVPPCVWAALRFGSSGAVTSVSTVSVIAIVATVQGDGPFAHLPGGSSLLVLRLFIGSLAVTALLVAAEAGQHHRLEQELNRTRKELQRALSARTAELDAARSLAKAGTWNYQVATKKLVWSDEMYPLFGFGEERFPVELESALQHVMANDRELFLRDLERAAGFPESMSTSLPDRRVRVEHPDGERLILLCSLRIAELDNGRATRLAGTVIDITERERIEAELRRLRSGDEPSAGRPEDLRLWMIPWMGKRRP